MGYTWDVLLLLACQSVAVPTPALAPALDTPDEVVEYKFALRPDVTPGEARTAWDGAMRPAPAPDGKHEGKVWDDKDCRSVQLYPVSPTHLVRSRVEHRKKTCDSPPTNWDASEKWLVDTPGSRPEGAGETDWIAGKSGVTVRYATGRTIERDGIDVPGDPPALFEVDADPVCAEPVHELRWKTTHDRDVDGAPLPKATVTTWTLAGEPLATELSFKGTPQDLQRAEQVRAALEPLLAESAASKTQAALKACGG